MIIINVGIIIEKKMQIMIGIEWGLIKDSMTNGMIFWIVKKIVIVNHVILKAIIGIQKCKGALPVFKINLKKEINE